jgi:hypothetical protein
MPLLWKVELLGTVKPVLLSIAGTLELGIKPDGDG